MKLLPVNFGEITDTMNSCPLRYSISPFLERWQLGCRQATCAQEEKKDEDGISSHHMQTWSMSLLAVLPNILTLRRRSRNLFRASPSGSAFTRCARIQSRIAARATLGNLRNCRTATGVNAMSRITLV